jgi:chromosome segregation ATPase
MTDKDRISYGKQIDNLLDNLEAAFKSSMSQEQALNTFSDILDVMWLFERPCRLEINALRSQLADARQKNIKLNLMLGKAQSRDSSTTNKKLRKEIEKLKWEMENMQGTLTFERPDDKRIFEIQVENQKLTAENKKLTQRIADLEAELVSVRDQLQQATDYVGELERENKILKRERATR